MDVVRLPPQAASILLVDDHPANLIALEAVLEPLGHKLLSVRSGEEALRRADTEEFAVILLDVQMPGIDGFETATRLRQVQRARHTPLIFLTAIHKEPASAHRAYSLGAFDYIIKPYDADLVRARVSALAALYLGNRRMEAQSAELRLTELAAERERVAREAAEAANRTKDEFLAMVSHELRTPLNAILGWAELLQNEALDRDRFLHGLQTIARNARSQAKLIDDLLDVSRIIAGKLSVRREELDVAQAVRRAAETVAPTASQRRVQIEVAIEPGPHLVLGDGERLQQVFWNLLANAVKFSPEGARVDVELIRDGDQAAVRVVDHGAGIEPGFLPHVFERFRQGGGGFTRARGGLGLGLAIVRHIVELHGGTIRAESAGAGMGATFTVRLPSVDALPRTAEATSAITSDADALRRDDRSTPLRGVRVLYADDDDDARELAAAILSVEGAVVTPARDVPEATTLAAKQPFDVVVSDIAMPGEDGYSLIGRLRQQSRVPAIALSAFTTMQDRERALEAGFDAHVSKPVEPATLTALIRRLVGR
jgi:signal transduction histidine kinase